MTFITEDRCEFTHPHPAHGHGLRPRVGDHIETALNCVLHYLHGLPGELGDRGPCPACGHIVIIVLPGSTPPPAAVGRVVFTIGPVVSTQPARQTPGATASGVTPRKADVRMNILDNQQFPFSATPEDAAGEPTADTVTVSVDDPTVLTLTANGDGTYTAAATGKLGTAVLTAADNSVTPPLLGVLSVAVTAGPTTQIAFTTGDVTDIPSAAAPADAAAAAGDGAAPTS